MNVSLYNSELSDETDNKGGFVLQGINQGVKTLIFKSSEIPECNIFYTFIPPGHTFQDLGKINYSELAVDNSLCDNIIINQPIQSIPNKV